MFMIYGLSNGLMVQFILSIGSPSIDFTLLCLGYLLIFVATPCCCYDYLWLCCSAQRQYKQAITANGHRFLLLILAQTVVVSTMLIQSRINVIRKAFGNVIFEYFQCVSS